MHHIEIDKDSGFCFGVTTAISKAEEMIVGVAFPVFCLIAFELYYKLNHKISHRYVEYQEWEKENNCIKETERKEDKVMTEADNKFSKRVISYGIFLTGAAIALLGGLAEKGKCLDPNLASW